MKHISNIMGKFFGLLVLLALVGTVIISHQGQSDTGAFQSPIGTPTLPQPTGTTLPIPATPVPPLGVTPVGTIGTSTPQPSEYGTPLGMPAPTATLIDVFRTTDLAPELPDSEKVHVYVHLDSTIELFLIRRGADISTTVPLQAGDVVIFASLKTTPPRSTASATPSPTIVSPLATPTQVSVTPEN